MTKSQLELRVSDLEARVAELALESRMTVHIHHHYANETKMDIASEAASDTTIQLENTSEARP